MVPPVLLQINRIIPGAAPIVEKNPDLVQIIGSGVNLIATKKRTRGKAQTRERNHERALTGERNRGKVWIELIKLTTWTSQRKEGTALIG